MGVKFGTSDQRFQIQESAKSGAKSEKVPNRVPNLALLITGSKSKKVPNRVPNPRKVPNRVLNPRKVPNLALKVRN